MMSYKSFQIKDILEFQPKSKRKAGEGLETGEYPFFTSSQNQRKWFPIADYRTDAVILGTGGIPSVHFSAEFSTSTDVFVLAPKSKNISAKYVSFFLAAKKELLEKGFKGAGLKHLSRGYVEKLDVRLPVDGKGVPDRAEQTRIVAILEEAETLKKKRAEADMKMEELVPALFDKVFGRKKSIWPKTKISEIVKGKGAIRTGPFGSALHHSEFTETGIPVLAIDNVSSNKFKRNELRNLPPEKYSKFKQFRVYPSDVLVTIMGTVGRVCVAPDNLPESMSTKHLCVITPDTTKINPQFLRAELLFDADVRHQTRNVAKGAIMEGWNSTIIKNLKISIPPIDLQNKFAEAVKEIEEQKEKQNLAGEKTDELFASLLGKYFPSS